MDSTLQNSTSDGEWTVVVSRKERRQSKPKKVQPWKPNHDVKPKKYQEERPTPEPINYFQEGPWKPEDRVVDPERQARLLDKIQFSIWQTKRSTLYTKFFEQLRSPQLLEQFRLVLGTEKQLQMVIYGLGRMEKVKPGRDNSLIQLSIALLMKKEFDWIGEIQVFDPVFSATECSVLTSLGCTVLYVNENARREAVKPTLFFMPFCPNNLYNNLLQANCTTNRLSKIALLGNSFQNTSNITKTGLPTSISEFSVEKIKEGPKSYRTAFNGSSWHFFNSGIDVKLLLLDVEVPLLDFGLFPPLTK